jgi:Holliday junction resolvase
MAQTPESKVKASIKKILVKHGIYYVMPIGSGFGNAGVPDFICNVNGKFLAIEAKAGRGQLTALQEKNLKKINVSNGVGIVVREDMEEYLEGVIIGMEKL